MKTCTKCKEEKPFEDFNKEVKRKDGYYPWCKVCLSDHRKARYRNVPRKIWIEQKVCSKCKEWKPREEYRQTTARNLHNRCITCEDREKQLDSEGMTECSSCRQVKPLTDFYKSRVEKTSKQCIDCHKAYHTHPAGYDRRRDSALSKYFGISLPQYKELLEKQEYRCPLCLEEFEPNKYSYPVDHAHGGPYEGVIRAILHDKCNRFVMANHTDPETLRRAADLMENPMTDWFVPEEYIKSRKKKKARKPRKVKHDATS